MKFSTLSDITAEQVNERLSYDKDTGVFTRKHRFGFRNSTSKKVGSYDSEGYLRISLDNRSYKAHRLAILMTTGKWPEHVVDHIDGNKANNRLTNLRCVDQSVNAHNKSMDDVKGFSWNKRDKRWYGRFFFRGKNYYIGCFKTIEEARNSYISKKQEMNLLYRESP